MFGIKAIKPDTQIEPRITQMFNRTIKTALIAAAVVVATAGASFASTWAYVDHDSKVKKFHKNGSESVNYVEEGQKVKIVGSWGNWYKIKVPGPDGWVKANALDFAPGPFPGPYNGGSFCINGQNAQFCISGGY